MQTLARGGGGKKIKITRKKKEQQWDFRHLVAGLDKEIIDN